MKKQSKLNLNKNILTALNSKENAVVAGGVKPLSDYVGCLSGFGMCLNKPTAACSKAYGPCKE